MILDTEQRFRHSAHRRPAGMSATARSRQQQPEAASSHQQPPEAASNSQKPGNQSGCQQQPETTSSHQQSPADARSHQQKPEVARSGPWWLLVAPSGRSNASIYFSAGIYSTSCHFRKSIDKGLESMSLLAFRRQAPWLRKIDTEKNRYALPKLQ